jgi:hypothetical protein
VSGKGFSVCLVGHTEGFLPLVALPDSVSKRLSFAIFNFSPKTTLKYYHNSKSQSICYNRNSSKINL